MSGDILVVVLPRIHIILGILLLVSLIVIFPKDVRKADKEWFRNNVGSLLVTSFGIGGFVSIGIGLLFVLVNGSWPLNYIPPDSIAEHIIITIIYLGSLTYHDLTSFRRGIRQRYGKIKPAKK